MEEKQREQKRARTVRTDYLADVEELQAWVARAELQVQDRSVEPLKLREHLRQIQTELGPIGDKLERLTKNGRTIVDNTNDQGEKELIEKTILNLTEQIGQVRAWLEEKKQQVGDSLDAWQRFLVLYESVTAWTLEKRNFLKEPLRLSTLVQTRQRLHDYSTAVKSCKQVNKNLSEMGKELELIGQITSVGDLPEKLASAEEAKVEVEGKLLETNALLQEASEEWEQCEKKFKDVKSFLEKARQSLDSAQNKKKPLRDQHALREKMLSDIAIQKTKISISVEKLQVHFRSGISGDNKISETAADMTAELTSLNDVVKEQTAQLEACLSQIDQYQQEIQQLRQQIVQVEQQLRSALSPTYLPNDREKAVQEQQTLQVQMDEWRQRTRLLTDNILALDPYYMPPVDQRPTGLVSYAEIVAGRSTPVSRNSSPFRTAVELLPLPPPRVAPTEEPKIKTPKPRRGRSPTRKIKKPAVEVEKPVQEAHRQVPAQSSLNLPVEPRLNRSPSPVWVPGSTSYADMVRKARQEAERVAQDHEMVRLSKEHESNRMLKSPERVPVSLRPSEVEEKPEEAYRGLEQPAIPKESWADEPIDYEIMEKFENESTPAPEMYSYMHPIPELVQFIGTGLASYPVGGFVFQNAPGHLEAPLTAYEHFVSHQNYLATPEIYSGATVGPQQGEILYRETIPEDISRPEPEEIQVEPPTVTEISSCEEMTLSKDQGTTEAAAEVRGISYAKILSQGLPERPISPVFLPQRSRSPHEVTPPEAKLERKPVEAVEKRERDWDTIKKNPRKKMQDKKEPTRKEPQERGKIDKTKIEKFIEEEKKIVVTNVPMIEDVAEEKLSEGSQEKKRKKKKKAAKSTDDEIDQALKEIADMEKQKKLPKVREYTLQHDDSDKIKSDRGKRVKVVEEKKEIKGSSKREDITKSVSEIKTPEVQEVKVGGKSKGKNRSDAGEVIIDCEVRRPEAEKCVERVKEKSRENSKHDDSPRSSKKREEKSKKVDKKLDKENSNPEPVKMEKIKTSGKTTGDNINLKKDIKTPDVEEKESMTLEVKSTKKEEIEEVRKTCEDTKATRQQNVKQGKSKGGKNLSKQADNSKLISTDASITTTDVEKSEKAADKLENKKEIKEIKSSNLPKVVDKIETSTITTKEITESAKLIENEKSMKNTKKITNETVKGKSGTKEAKKSKETSPIEKIIIKETISSVSVDVTEPTISSESQKSEEEKSPTPEKVQSKEISPPVQSDSKLKKKHKSKSSASTKISTEITSIPPSVEAPTSSTSTTVSATRTDSQVILTEERVSSKVEQLVTLRPASVEANLINTYSVISTIQSPEVKKMSEKSSIDLTKAATESFIQAEGILEKDSPTSGHIMTVKIPTDDEAPLFGSVQDRKKSRSISAAGAEQEVCKDPQEVKTDAKKTEIHKEIKKPPGEVSEKIETLPVSIVDDLVQPYWLDAHRYYEAESNFYQNYKVVKVVNEPQPPPSTSVPKSSSIERIVQQSKMKTTDTKDEIARKIEATKSLIFSETSETSASTKQTVDCPPDILPVILPPKISEAPSAAILNEKASLKSSEKKNIQPQDVEKCTKSSIEVVVGILDEPTIKNDQKTDKKILETSKNVESRGEEAQKPAEKLVETSDQVQKTDKKSSSDSAIKIDDVQIKKDSDKPDQMLQDIAPAQTTSQDVAQQPEKLISMMTEIEKSIIEPNLQLEAVTEESPRPTANLMTEKIDPKPTETLETVKPIHLVSSDAWMSILDEPMAIDDFDDDDKKLETPKKDAGESSTTLVTKVDEISIQTTEEISTAGASEQKLVEKSATIAPEVSEKPETLPAALSTATGEGPHRKKSKKQKKKDSKPEKVTEISPTTLETFSNAPTDVETDISHSWDKSFAAVVGTTQVSSTIDEIMEFKSIEMDAKVVKDVEEPFTMAITPENGKPGVGDVTEKFIESEMSSGIDSNSWAAVVGKKSSEITEVASATVPIATEHTTPQVQIVVEEAVEPVPITEVVQVDDQGFMEVVNRKELRSRRSRSRSRSARRDNKVDREVKPASVDIEQEIGVESQDLSARDNPPATVKSDSTESDTCIVSEKEVKTSKKSAKSKKEVKNLPNEEKTEVLKIQEVSTTNVEPQVDTTAAKNKSKQKKKQKGKETKVEPEKISSAKDLTSMTVDAKPEEKLLKIDDDKVGMTKIDEAIKSKPVEKNISVEPESEKIVLEATTTLEIVGEVKKTIGKSGKIISEVKLPQQTEKVKPEEVSKKNETEGISLVNTTVEKIEDISQSTLDKIPDEKLLAAVEVPKDNSKDDKKKKKKDKKAEKKSEAENIVVKQPQDKPIEKTDDKSIKSPPESPKSEKELEKTEAKMKTEKKKSQASKSLENPKEAAKQPTPAAKVEEKSLKNTAEPVKICEKSVKPEEKLPKTVKKDADEKLSPDKAENVVETSTELKPSKKASPENSTKQTPAPTVPESKIIVEKIVDFKVEDKPAKPEVSKTQSSEIKPEKSSKKISGKDATKKSSTKTPKQLDVIIDTQTTPKDEGKPLESVSEAPQASNASVEAEKSSKTTGTSMKNTKKKSKSSETLKKPVNIVEQQQPIPESVEKMEEKSSESPKKSDMMLESAKMIEMEAAEIILESNDTTALKSDSKKIETTSTVSETPKTVDKPSQDSKKKSPPAGKQPTLKSVEKLEEKTSQSTPSTSENVDSSLTPEKTPNKAGKSSKTGRKSPEKLKNVAETEAMLEAPKKLDTPAGVLEKSSKMIEPLPAVESVKNAEEKGLKSDTTVSEKPEKSLQPEKTSTKTPTPLKPTKKSSKKSKNIAENKSPLQTEKIEKLCEQPGGMAESSRMILLESALDSEDAPKPQVKRTQPEQPESKDIQAQLPSEKIEKPCEPSQPSEGVAESSRIIQLESTITEQEILKQELMPAEPLEPVVTSPPTTDDIKDDFCVVSNQAEPVRESLLQDMVIVDASEPRPRPLPKAKAIADLASQVGAAQIEICETPTAKVQFYIDEDDIVVVSHAPDVSESTSSSSPRRSSLATPQDMSMDSFWPEKHEYHDAERQYFERMAKRKQKVSDIKDSFDPRDDNDDLHDSGGSGPRGPFSPDSSAPRTERLVADLPGGMCSWNDYSTYLSLGCEVPRVDPRQNLQNISSVSEPISSLCSPATCRPFPQHLGLATAMDLRDQMEPGDLTESAQHGIQTNPKAEIEELQKSFNLFEESLNNLPQENLSTMQEKFTSIQESLMHYDSLAVDLAEKLEKMNTEDTSTLAATLQTIRSRIAELLEQVQTGLTAVKLAQDLQQQQKKEISMYMTFLEETDVWVRSLITTINQDHSADSFKMLENEIDDRTRRVAELEDLPDVGLLARSLKEALLDTSTRLRQKQQELEDEGSARASDDLGRDDATLDQAPSIHSGDEISWADVSLQTGQSLLIEQKPEQLTKQTSTSQSLDPIPVEVQSMPIQVSLGDTQPPQETIKILKTASDTHDMIEIATKNILPSTAQFLAQERASEDIVVDMKYQDAQQTAKSELNIQLVAPQTFETILVEPDDVTTEVVIDADGTKRIIVRKLRRTIVTSTHTQNQDATSTQMPLIQPSPGSTFTETGVRDQQVTITHTRPEGSNAASTTQAYVTTGEIPSSGIDVGEVEGGNFKIEGSGFHTTTSMVHATVQQVTRRVIRKTRRTIQRVTIIDGKEMVSEEVVEEPDEIEIDDRSIPQISINVVKREEYSGEKLAESEGEVSTQGPFFGPFAKELTPECSQSDNTKEISALEYEEMQEKNDEKTLDLSAPLELEEEAQEVSKPADSASSEIKEIEEDICKSTDAPVTSEAIVESGTLEIEQHNGSSTVEIADKPVVVLESQNSSTAAVEVTLSPENLEIYESTPVIRDISVVQTIKLIDEPSVTFKIEPEKSEEEHKHIDTLSTRPESTEYTPEILHQSEAYIEPEKSDSDSTDSRNIRKKKRRRIQEDDERFLAAESNSSIATTIAESVVIDLPSDSPKQSSVLPSPDILDITDVSLSLSNADKETINSGYEAEQGTLEELSLTQDSTDSKKKKKQLKRRQKVKIDSEQVTEVPKSTTDEAAFSDEMSQPEEQLRPIKKHKIKSLKTSETKNLVEVDSQTSPDRVDTPASEVREALEVIDGIEMGQQTTPEPAKIMQEQAVETAREELHAQMQTSPTPLLDSAIQTTTVKSPDLEHSSMQTETLEPAEEEAIQTSPVQLEKPIETEEIDVQATTEVNSSAMQTTPEIPILSEMETQTLMIQEFIDAEQQTTPPAQMEEILKHESTVQTSPLATTEVDIQTSAPASPEVATQNFEMQVDLIEEIPVAVMETQTTPTPQVTIGEIEVQTKSPEPTIESVVQTSPEPEDLQIGVDLSAQTSLECLKITAEDEAQTIPPAVILTAETYVQLDRKDLVFMCEESVQFVPQTLDTCSQTPQEEKQAIEVISTAQQITVESLDVSTMPEGGCMQDTATSPIPVETVDIQTEQIVQGTANASTEPIPLDTQDTATSPIEEFIRRESSHETPSNEEIIQAVVPESIVETIEIEEAPSTVVLSPPAIKEVEIVETVVDIKKIEEIAKIVEKVEEKLQEADSASEKPESISDKDLSLEIHVQATIEMSGGTTTESSVATSTAEEPSEASNLPSDKSRRRPKKKRKPKPQKSREGSPSRDEVSRVPVSFAPPIVSQDFEILRPTYSEVSKRDLKNRGADEPDNVVPCPDEQRTMRDQKHKLNGQEVSFQVTMEQSNDQNHFKVHDVLSNVSPVEEVSVSLEIQETPVRKTHPSLRITTDPEPMDTSEEIFSPTDLMPTGIDVKSNEKSYTQAGTVKTESPKAETSWEDNLMDLQALAVRKTPSPTSSFIAHERMDMTNAQTLAETTLASRMMLDRLKNLQNAKETTYLSKIIHMLTLTAVASPAAVEKCNAEVQTELSHLRSAVEEQNNVAVEQTLITIVETISTWIETIEYRILSGKDEVTGPTYSRNQGLAQLRNEVSHVKENINELGDLWQRVEPQYPPEECETIRECMDSLVSQVQAIEDVASAEEQQSTQDLSRWEQFLNGIDNIYSLVQEHSSQLDSILQNDRSTIWKLEELEKLENTNRCHMWKTKKLLASAKILLREHPGRIIPEEAYLADDMTQTIEHNICVERERLLQQLALADEYERTLLEFAQITDIAEELLASAIAVVSLEHLQEEMQKHRKFFVNLNHCRAILESLGDNLDLETRTKHAALHEELHSKANSLLDAAAIRAQKMSLAASRWMLLEQGMKEERGWLQVAHQRVPDLLAVTSTDYDQYVSLYEALSSDIGAHHARLVQLLSVANSLHELITIEDPEDRYGEALEVITRLRSDVESSLMRLLNFRDSWISRDLAHNRLELWMATAERELAGLKDNWAGRMSRFWDLKAQYEVHNNIRGDANASFEQALKILPLSDEMLQRQFQGDFEDRWQSVASQIQAIQEAVANKISSEDIPANEKLHLLEEELRELHTTIDGFHGVLKTSEELELYVERLTVLYERVCEIQDELGRVGMLPAAESERVGLLLSLARRIESQIGEEQDLAHLLHERLQHLLQGIARVRRAHAKEAQVLDQCEACDKKGSDEVASAVSRCQEVSEELSNVWKDLMGLRQVLHTLPGGMRVSVSPVGIERDISSLQDTNAALESRAARLFSHLRTRLNLWRRFERQLELVQQSVQEADYMVELLSVQGTVDYERLIKATERLESLNGDLGAQEVCLIGELREAAEHLREACTPEVSERVAAAVSEAVQAWDDTRAQLDALCTKYQRAAKLWEQYREAVDTVTSWVDTQMGDISNLSPEEGQQKVKVCEETLAEHKERLAELRDLVAQIASDVGLESDGPLHFEVEALGRRLEDVRETLSTLADTADARALNQELARGDLCQTKNFLDSVQQSLSTVGQGESKEQLKLLRSHLLALTRTEPQLQSIKDRALEVVEETTVVEVLQLWQRVFRETFQQYHRISARLVRSQDVSAALRLWQEYLANVQEFLSNDLPGDYNGLSEHRNLCQVHRNLLTDQQHLILSIRADKRRDLSVAEQFNALTNLHNETLSKIMERHAAVRDRLAAWDRYKRDQTQLLSWLKDIEREKSKLHLRFIHLRRLEKLIAKIEQLLEKIPVGQAQLDGLFEQQETLLAGAEEALAVSVRMEHAANVQRVANARASLETWRDFVLRIRKLSANHNNQSSGVATTFVEVSTALNTAFHTPASREQAQQQLDSLQVLKTKLIDTTAELEALGVTTEQLRECLSPSDMKNLNQQCSLLWQQHGDLEHQLALLAYRLSERLSLRSKWEKRHARLLVWITDAEARVSADKSLEEPEEALKRLEGELHAEMALKQHDLDWIVTTAGELMNFGGDERIQEALNELNERWTRLSNAGKARAGKLVDLMQTMSALERRIAEIRAWLGKIELQLTEPLVLEAKTQVAFDRQLADHETLQKAIEAESGNIGEVLNLCEILVSDCDAWRASFNTDALKAGMQGLEKRWKTTCVRSAERKRNILTAWKLIQELDKIASEQENWVEQIECELRLHANPEKLSKEESQIAAAKMRSILQDIEAHSPALVILEQSYSRLVKGGLEPENVRQLMDHVRELIQRWSALKAAATTILAALSQEHAAYREFVTAHGSAVIALTQIDVNLTQIQHLSASASPRRQLQQLDEVEQELAVQNATLARADELALSVMQGSHAGDVHEIQELVDEYQLLWQDIKSRVMMLRTKLEDRREVDEAVQVETLKFEQDSAVQVDTLPKLVRMTSCDAYLMELQSALAECRDAVAELEETITPEPVAGPGLASTAKNIARLIGSCSSAMELARHLHALLMQDGKLSDEAKSAAVDELGARYDAVLSRARAREQQIREISDGGRLTCPLCSQRNWAQLDIDLWRLEKWLDFAEATQSGQHSPPREIEELEEVIQDHREFLLNSDSHKSIVVSLNIVGTHLADHTEDAERAQDLRDRLAKANARWDRVCQTAQSWQASLQSSLLGNQQFHAIVDELLTWLERTESSIRASEPIDLTEDSSVIRAKYNKFKELRSDLEKCEPRVLSLQEAANQLLDQNLEIRSRVQELRLRLQSLRRLTGIYALKLGAALGLDPKEVGLVATTSSLASLSQDLLDGSSSGANQHDNASATDGDERDRTVLVRGYRFIGRVIRASLPIQALMLLLLGVASLVPTAEDDYSCMLSNNLARTFNPVVNYPNGPPPL